MLTSWSCPQYLQTLVCPRLSVPSGPHPPECAPWSHGSGGVMVTIATLSWQQISLSRNGSVSGGHSRHSPVNISPTTAPTQTHSRDKQSSAYQRCLPIRRAITVPLYSYRECTNGMPHSGSMGSPVHTDASEVHVN